MAPSLHCLQMHAPGHLEPMVAVMGRSIRVGIRWTPHHSCRKRVTTNSSENPRRAPFFPSTKKGVPSKAMRLRASSTPTPTLARTTWRSPASLKKPPTAHAQACAIIGLRAKATQSAITADRHLAVENPIPAFIPDLCGLVLRHRAPQPLATFEPQSPNISLQSAEVESNRSSAEHSFSGSRVTEFGPLHTRALISDPFATQLRPFFSARAVGIPGTPPFCTRKHVVSPCQICSTRSPFRSSVVRPDEFFFFSKNCSFLLLFATPTFPSLPHSLPSLSSPPSL